MKHILLIVGGDFHRTSGVENYNLLLLNILKENYKNYNVDIMLLNCDQKPEKLDFVNVNFVYFKIKKNKPFRMVNLFTNWLNLIIERIALKKIINNYDLIVDSSLTNFSCVKSYSNYYLVQHFNLDYYDLHLDSSEFGVKKIIRYIWRWFNGTLNFLNKISNFVVFDDLNKEIVNKACPSLKVFPIALPSKIGSISQDKLSFDKNRIIFLGRLSRQKNIPVLMKLNESLNLIDFYGSPFGDRGEYYKNCLLKKGWYKGNISNNKDLIATLQKYKFMILDSKFEGFPFSLVEALSQGLPLIVKDTFLSASFLCNQKTGLILPKNTTINEDIKLINNFILIQDEQYHQYQINCVDFYNQNLKFDIFARKWKTIFDEYLEKIVL